MSKPKRDPNATDLEPIDKGGPAAAPAAPPAPEGDAPMPTVENAPPLLFRPGSGCSILDVFEVCLMYLLVINNTRLDASPGILRNMQMPADRASMLSDSARRFMVPAATTPEAPPAPPEPAKS